MGQPGVMAALGLTWGQGTSGFASGVAPGEADARRPEVGPEQQGAVWVSGRKSTQWVFMNYL